jgi:hypothetical protein
MLCVTKWLISFRSDKIWLFFGSGFGGLRGIRTPNPWNRNPVLYPVELGDLTPPVSPFTVTVSANYVALGNFSVKFGVVGGGTLRGKKLGNSKVLLLAGAMIKVHHVVGVRHAAVGAGLSL